MKLRKPPWTDKARWMGYAINVLLAWLLQDQIEIPEDQLNAVFEVVRFISYIYVIPWFRSPFVVDAAKIELDMLKCLEKYER